MKIDIRQGEVPEVVPAEDESTGESEDSTQAGGIERPSDNQEGAGVPDVVRSIVFTTGRPREITTTTTEEVVTIEPTCIQLISPY